MFFLFNTRILKRKKKRNKSKFCCSIETLIHLLSDVVRANKNTADCSEYEIIEIIKSWLVRSKERFYNNTRTLGSDAPKKAQTEPKKTTPTKRKKVSTELKEIEQEAPTKPKRTVPNEEQIE